MNDAPQPTEDNYDETTHVAIYRKPNDPENQSVSPFLAQKNAKPAKTISGGRPTSGKHYARERVFAKKQGELEDPNDDPLTSSVAKNFEKSKQIEGLLNRLAGYMAGEIPDNGDLNEIFKKE